jgi:hypothetical protein
MMKLFLLGFLGAALAAPPDYPLWCRGTAGMASANGKDLVVNFRFTDHPAGEGLQPGQCSWLDRGFRPNEPLRIVDTRPSAAEARITAGYINEGQEWTFWIYNAGNYMRAAASSAGLQKAKPVRID